MYFCSYIDHTLYKYKLSVYMMNNEMSTAPNGGNFEIEDAFGSSKFFCQKSVSKFRVESDPRDSYSSQTNRHY